MTLYFRIRSFINIFIIGTYSVKASKITSVQIQPFTFDFWINLFISLFFILFAGLCSGLTVGYLSIKRQTLIIWLDSKDQQKITKAKTILDVLQNHHLLLSTLLLSNAISMEALPIFLHKIIPAYLAVIFSTLAVLIFGEVIPQAYCTGANQISIAYTFSSFVKFLQFTLGIFVRPIAWLLDKWLGVGQEKIIFTKQNLKTLLKLHNSKQYGYRPQQIEMLQNTLDLREKNVKQCMIPINRIFMMDQDRQIDNDLMNTIKKYNYSIIPLFSKDYNKVKGTIRTKNLVGIGQNGIRLGCLQMENAVFIEQSVNLLDAFEILKNKKKKIGFLVKDNLNVITKYKTSQEIERNKQLIGIITLKRIFQQITLKQFEDDDNRKKFTSKEFFYKSNLNKQTKRSEDIIQAQQQD